MEGKAETNRRAEPGAISGAVRFFVIQPANMLLGISVLFLLPDVLFPLDEARLAMAAGIFGASFGFGNYRDDGGGLSSWWRAPLILATLNLAGLVAGYLVAALVMLTGAAIEQPWKEILLILPPLLAADFLTPAVAKLVAGLAKDKLEDKGETT